MPATAAVATPQLPPIVPVAPAGKQDVSKIINTFTEAVPQLMGAFNKIMKEDDGNNPMAQMVKQLMSPNETHTGVMNNLAANALESIPESVMSQVQEQVSGLSAADIIQKLKRLESFEKARAKRRNRK
jgi:hypothetical protein